MKRSSLTLSRAVGGARFACAALPALLACAAAAGRAATATFNILDDYDDGYYWSENAENYTYDIAVCGKYSTNNAP